MLRKFLGIISEDFDATEQQMIVYSAFRKKLRKWQYNEAVYQLFIDFKKSYGSVRTEILYNIITEKVSPWNGKPNVFEWDLEQSQGSKTFVWRFLSRMVLKEKEMLYRHCFFNSALDFANRRVRVNQNGLKLDGAHRHLVNVDGVNILGRSAHTIK